MNAILGGKSIVRLVLAWTLVAMVPICQAQTTSLDKHARKIHKYLTRYSTGTLVNVELRDGSELTGALDTLAPASFTITDSDNNARETQLYSDVTKVSKGKEYIGEGSGRSHHFQHPWRAAFVGVFAAGAAATAYEVR